VNEKAAPEEAASEVIAATDSSVSCEADRERYFDIGADAGYTLGYQEGFRDGSDRVHAEYQSWLGVFRPVLSLPLQEDLKQRRALSHDPCRARCRKCSQCIHSLAYWARGGRDYLGVEAERLLAQGGAA
jgi:hypothetical protein